MGPEVWNVGKQPKWKERMYLREIIKDIQVFRTFGYTRRTAVSYAIHDATIEWHWLDHPVIQHIGKILYGTVYGLGVLLYVCLLFSMVAICFLALGLLFNPPWTL